MKKLLLLLFSLILSFNSYGKEVELDFSSDTFCDKSPKAQLREDDEKGYLFYLPNQEKPYSGENLCVYLSNGQYYSRGEIKNGLREGKWEYWHENGQKKEERNYINGWERGEGGSVIVRYDNGQKRYEWNDNKDGKLDGKSISWNKDGQITSEKNYKDGELVSEINHKAEREAKAKAKLAEAREKLAEEKAREAEILAQEAAKELKEAEEKAREAEILAQEIAKKFKVKEAEDKLEEIKAKDVLKEAEKLAEEKARETEILAQEVAKQVKKAEEKRKTEEAKVKEAEEKRKLEEERLLVIEDQLNTLKSAYVSNIAARVRSFWRFQGAEDDWTAEVYIVQDRDGTVVAVDVRNSNVGDSQKAKVFKDSIRRAVYKASPLPSAPDEVVFDKELVIKFSVN